MGILEKSPYAPLAKVVNGKQCHFLEAGWGGTIRTAFEDCQNVTFKRVGGPSPITVYHPPSHEAGCAWGQSIPLRKWYFWDGAGAGSGGGNELRAGGPDAHITCHSRTGAPPPAGLSGPVGGVAQSAQGGGRSPSFTGPAWNLEASWKCSSLRF